MMNRPRLLDLFCGAGGCSVGYERAGFDVVGVDLESQPRYPFRFVQAHAFEVLADPFFLARYDALSASPPCQGYSIAGNNGSGKWASLLVPQTLAALRASGVPWVCENVPGAPMPSSIELCGAYFGLGAAGMDLSRHRRFESSFAMLAPPCTHRRGKTLGVYGHGTNAWHRKKLGRNIREAEKREAMGIDWMTRAELAEAIPPAYTEWIGAQLMAHLEASAA